MAKPIIRFKVNAQSDEVGGKLYGIPVDNPVTPEVSISQICEYMKITAYSPAQVLRLVEDICTGAAELVARDGQSRQISSLLKFSPRIRGTFEGLDSRFDPLVHKLIVGTRLLKDIKLDMDPAKFQISNVLEPTNIGISAFYPDGWTGGYTKTKIEAAFIAVTQYSELLVSGAGLADVVELVSLRHLRANGDVLLDNPVEGSTGSAVYWLKEPVEAGENFVRLNWHGMNGSTSFGIGSIAKGSNYIWQNGDYLEIVMKTANDTLLTAKLPIGQ